VAQTGLLVLDNGYHDGVLASEDGQEMVSYENTCTVVLNHSL